MLELSRTSAIFAGISSDVIEGRMAPRVSQSSFASVQVLAFVGDRKYVYFFSDASVVVAVSAVRAGINPGQSEMEKCKGLLLKMENVKFFSWEPAL